jgi:recombination protein RecA
MDPEYATKLGVNIDDMLISQPDFGRAGVGDRRDACEVEQRRRDRYRFGCRPVPRAELDGEMGDSAAGCRLG